MKKGLALLLVLVILLSLAACGSNTEIADNTDNQTSSGETQPDDGFVPDWTEGNENIYGYGSCYNGTVDQISTKDDYRFVTQDGWVYYVWVNNGIFKKPIDSSDSEQVFKLAPLSGWIYNLSVMKDWLYYFEDDQLVRLRTDGMAREVISLQSEKIGESDGFYLAHDQLYYIGKTHRSASEFSYELRRIDLETMEDTLIAPDVCNIIRGYKDSMFIKTPDKEFKRMDLDGNLLTEYSCELPKYLWDESQELFIGTIGEHKYAGDNLGYIWLNGETLRDEFLSDFGFNAGDFYVCEELGKVVHTKYEYDSSQCIYPRGIYCTDIESHDTITLNSDLTEVFYSWGDGYIYYPASINKGGRGVRAFCRIRPDGTGWEDVSWMFY